VSPAEFRHVVGLQRRGVFDGEEGAVDLAKRGMLAGRIANRDGSHKADGE